MTDLSEPAHRAKTRQYINNYDRIFRRGLLGDQVMRKNGVVKKVKIEDVMRFEKNGWRRVE